MEQPIEENTIITNRTSPGMANGGGEGGASPARAAASAAGGGNSGAGGPPEAAPTSPFVVGVSLPDAPTDAVEALRRAKGDGFEYAVTALPDVVGAYSAGGGGGSGALGPPRTDVARLESKWWSTSIVGAVVDPPRWRKDGTKGDDGWGGADFDGQGLLEALTSTSDTPAAAARRNEASKVFHGMMEWAAHMNVPAVILPPIPPREIREEGEEGGGADSPAVDPNNPSAKEYARLISSLASSPICASSRVQLWIRVPFPSPPAMAAYRLLLQRCDGSASVGCLLHAKDRLDSADLPVATRALHCLVGGGHVKALSWDIAAFLKNKRGYPTLSKAHQFVFAWLCGRLGRTLRILVEGETEEERLRRRQLRGLGLQEAASAAATSGAGAGLTHRLHHFQYLRHLRARPPLPSLLDAEESRLETPYLDSLQSPLQPLGDHLEYQTYETFERDPVKYKRYGEAIELALEDGMAEERYPCVGTTRIKLGELRKLVDPEDEPYPKSNDGETVEVDVHRVTILVVGAGRGPLVREAVRAVARASFGAASLDVTQSGRRGFHNKRMALHATVVAVEKNPGAVLYLRGLKGTDPSWNRGKDPLDPSSLRADDATIGADAIPGTSEVHVAGCDMREASTSSCAALRCMATNPAERADVVVSELLGSFGDNELSPECLDGVQRCGMLKEGCVSVPQSYTAYLAPVSSSRLHSEARSQSYLPLNVEEGPASPPLGMQRALETPYVVRSHAASQTHAERPCWTFSHPRPLQAGKRGSDAMCTDDNSGSGPLGGFTDGEMECDNDRRAHLTFWGDPGWAAGIGCGYGPVNADTAAVAMSGIDPNSDGTDVTIHGFIGSFHSMLYESPSKTKRKLDEMGNGSSGENDSARGSSSVISIAPSTFSVGMFSWFPLYFPLKDPLRVPAGASVNCSMWRRSDADRVWYEWCAEVVLDLSRGTGAKTIVGTSSVHNPGGRSYHVKK
ncbi:hypothetical protein ACHAWF_011088 [Thalassiosira exigua]